MGGLLAVHLVVTLNPSIEGARIGRCQAAGICT
jgi:hypothetical protein